MPPTDRPIYETQADRVRQAVAIRTLAKATKSEAVPTESLARWDYEMRRNGVVAAIVEVKCRNCRMSHHQTYMIGLAKALRLRQAALELKVAGVLLVAWQDGTGWLRVDVGNHEDWQTGMGGRTDRNDPMDTEPVAHFPMAWFRMLP